MCDNYLYSLPTSKLYLRDSLPYSTDYSSKSKSDETMENELRNLLDDSNGVQIFNNFLESEERAAHYLSFWFCCKGFRNADPSKTYDLIKGIYRTFIRSESKTAVALQPNTKKNIVDKISNKSGLDKTIFNDAQSEVWIVMLKDLYPRFVASDSYRRYQNEKLYNTEKVDKLYIPDLSKINSELPYVDYMTSSNPVPVSRGMIYPTSIPSNTMSCFNYPAELIKSTSGNNGGSADNSNKCNQSQMSASAITTTQCINNNNNNNNNGGGGGGNKDRRGIAETDPTAFYKQLSSKLEKLRIMQQCGRSLLNTHRMFDPVDDDPQKILEIHDSYVTKKDPRKMEVNSQSSKRDADIRSVISQDSGVATNCDQLNFSSYLFPQQYQPNIQVPNFQLYPHPQNASQWGLGGSDSCGSTNNNSTDVNQPTYLTATSPMFSPSTPYISGASNCSATYYKPTCRQYQHHYRHDHHHFRSRRRNKSEDQSVCSLEENSSQKVSYLPKKGKSQASDASSIFDSGVSSTYEQISHSWMITSDRVSHWIINQPAMVNTPAEPVGVGGGGLTSCTSSVIRRSCSAQTTAGGNNSSGNGGEVWIDACCMQHDQRQQQPKSVGTNTTAADCISGNGNGGNVKAGISAEVSSPVGNKSRSKTGSISQSSSTPLATDSAQQQHQQPPLVVGYYMCGDPVPYRTQVPRSQSSSSVGFTLSQFKQLLPRRGQYRYFFKRSCDEFEGNGAVQEEYTKDDSVLPLWEGKIVAKVEKIE